MIIAQIYFLVLIVFICMGIGVRLGGNTKEAGAGAQIFAFCMELPLYYFTYMYLWG